MRRMSALVMGLAGGALAPLAGVADFLWLASHGSSPSPDLGAMALAMLILSVAGVSIGVLFASFWNAVIDDQ